MVKTKLVRKVEQAREDLDREFERQREEWDAWDASDDDANDDQAPDNPAGKGKGKGKGGGKGNGRGWRVGIITRN